MQETRHIFDTFLEACCYCGDSFDLNDQAFEELTDTGQTQYASTWIEMELV